MVATLIDTDQLTISFKANGMPAILTDREYVKRSQRLEVLLFGYMGRRFDLNLVPGVSLDEIYAGLEKQGTYSLSPRAMEYVFAYRFLKHVGLEMLIESKEYANLVIKPNQHFGMNQQEDVSGWYTLSFPSSDLRNI